MVKGIKLKFTLLQNEILEFLMVNSGKSFNQRNLAKELRVSSTAIAKSLAGLENTKLIITSKDVSTKIISITLNRDNSHVIQLKRAYNLRSIYESGLVDFLEASFFSSTIILFGSYSFGEDTLNSDIDLALIGVKEQELNLKEYENFLKRKIVLQFYPSFKEIHKNLRENIFNGILLKGGIIL